jgi:tetratricopeptide (TPR) repeat protein
MRLRVLLNASLTITTFFLTTTSSSIPVSAHSDKGGLSMSKQEKNMSSQELVRYALQLEGYYGGETLVSDLEKLRQLLNLLTSAIQQDVSNADAYFHRYRISSEYYESLDGEYPDGIKPLISDLDAYLRLKPKGEYAYKAYLDRIYANRRIENYESIESDYKLIFALAPKDKLEDLYQDRGEYYMERGNYKSAIADFTASNSIYLRSQAYIKSGNLVGAANDLSNLINSEPLLPAEQIGIETFNPSIFDERGQLYLQLKNWQAAVTDFSTAIYYASAQYAATYKNPFENLSRQLHFLRRTLSGRAEAYFVRKEFDKSIEDLSAILTYINSDQIADIYEYDLGEVYLMRARAYSQLGQIPKAQADYQKAAAIAISPVGDPALAQQIQTEAGITSSSSGSGAASPNSAAGTSPEAGITPQNTNPSSCPPPPPPPPPPPSECNFTSTVSPDAGWCAGVSMLGNSENLIGFGCTH